MGIFSSVPETCEKCGATIMCDGGFETEPLHNCKATSPDKNCTVKTNCKFYRFADSVSCLFVEGVEFLTRDEIYNAIKREWKEIILEKNKEK